MVNWCNWLCVTFYERYFNSEIRRWSTQVCPGVNLSVFVGGFVSFGFRGNFVYAEMGPWDYKELHLSSLLSPAFSLGDVKVRWDLGCCESERSTTEAVGDDSEQIDFQLHLGVSLCQNVRMFRV